MNPFLRTENTIKPTYFSFLHRNQNTNSNGIERELEEGENTQNYFCIWHYFNNKILLYFQLIKIKSYTYVMLYSR